MNKKSVFFIAVSVFLITNVLYLPCNADDEIIPEPIVLEGVNDIDPLIDHVASARMVLLGEGSHGTLEFYEWRKEITKRLIENHGYDFVVVEGDWPAFSEINRYVKGIDEGDTDIEDLFDVFDRWPPWMWRNETVVNLVRWMRDYNSEKDADVGFYGLDVQNVAFSYGEVIEKIKNLEPDEMEEILSELEKFGVYVDDEMSYARDYIRNRISYRQPLLDARSAIEGSIIEKIDSVDALDLDRNMATLIYGEKSFRARVDRTIDNWNVRVEFMNETIETLLEHYGEESKGIVWAHNTHIGDARATSMAEEGRLNIGQLQRELLGEENVKLVGFGTGTGTVRAGYSWEGRGEVMDIPQPMQGSYEELFSRMEHEKMLYLFTEEKRTGKLMEPRGHRAIGVVYDPDREHLGNYVETVLPERYDAFIFFQTTQVIHEW